jgi:hypothetical protein
MTVLLCCCCCGSHLGYIPGLHIPPLHPLSACAICLLSSYCTTCHRSSLTSLLYSRQYLGIGVPIVVVVIGSLRVQLVAFITTFFPSCCKYHSLVVVVVVVVCLLSRTLIVQHSFLCVCACVCVCACSLVIGHCIYCLLLGTLSMEICT